MNKGLLLMPILLIAGCTPVVVMDLDNDCELTTERRDNTITEYWSCSGEKLTDDDLAMISAHGVTK